MTEFDPNLTPEENREENSAGYTPASFEKRTAAWTGIAYTLMVLFVITYSIFTGGGSLNGTFPLFLIPVCAAAAVIAVHRYRAKAASLPVTVLVLLCCAAGLVLGAALGVPALAACLQNPYGA